MKAVVMAGGEGTRLRPLTSNQPKPMVPIVGKPCIEHILELLRKHGLEDVIVTVAFMPQAIRGYFGDGETLGMNIEYSVEESPLGTAGSVRLASDRLDETFLVISGDALCDVDLTELIDTHKREGRCGHDRAQVGREPARVRDRRHRRGGADRALPREAVLGPGLLGHDQHRHLRARARGAAPRPGRRAVRLLEGALPVAARDGPAALRARARRLLAGHRQPRPVPAGELRRARRARAARTSAASACAATSGSAKGWRSTTSTDRGAGLSSATTAAIAPDASVGPYSVLAHERDAARARAHRALGDRRGDAHRPQRPRRGRDRRPACDIRAHARVQEGVAIGDEVTLGAESVVMPGVRIYPYKEVETGAQIHESLIWESRGIVAPVRQGRRLRARQRRPDAGRGGAPRRGARDGAEARRARRREPRGAARLPDDQAGDDLRPQLDRRQRRRPARAPGRRRPPRAEDARATTPASTSASSYSDPEMLGSSFFEQPGIQLTAATQKEIEKHYSRGELRRAAFNEVGSPQLKARVVLLDFLLQGRSELDPRLLVEADLDSLWVRCSSRRCESPRRSPRSSARGG